MFPCPECPWCHHLVSILLNFGHCRHNCLITLYQVSEPEQQTPSQLWLVETRSRDSMLGSHWCTQCHVLQSWAVIGQWYAWSVTEIVTWDCGNNIHQTQVSWSWDWRHWSVDTGLMMDTDQDQPFTWHIRLMNCQDSLKTLSLQSLLPAKLEFWLSSTSKASAFVLVHF